MLVSKQATTTSLWSAGHFVEVASCERRTRRVLKIIHSVSTATATTLKEWQPRGVFLSRSSPTVSLLEPTMAPTSRRCAAHRVLLNPNLQSAAFTSLDAQSRRLAKNYARPLWSRWNGHLRSVPWPRWWAKLLLRCEHCRKVYLPKTFCGVIRTGFPKILLGYNALVLAWDWLGGILPHKKGKKCRFFYIYPASQLESLIMTSSAYVGFWVPPACNLPAPLWTRNSRSQWQFWTIACC